MKSVSFQIFILVLRILGTDIETADSARILGLFAMEAKSHFDFSSAIMKSLAIAGHQVTVIAPFQLENPIENMTLISSKAGSLHYSNPLEIVARRDISWLTVYNRMLDMLEENCRNVMSLQELLDILNANERLIDVVFVELIPMYECFLPLLTKLNVPIIGTVPFRSVIDADYLVGNLRNPSTFLAEIMLANLNMNFLERIRNTADVIGIQLAKIYGNRRIARFYQENFPNFDYNNAPKFSIVFVNSHISVLPRIVSPNYIHIGGLNVKTKALNPLPQNIFKFIEDAKDGVILFSLGSIVTSNTTSPEMLSAISQVFAEIPQRVIWKFDKRIENLSDNVLVLDWTPQREILAHKNVLTFISHCGINSVYESIYFAKPLIMMPIFGDQPGNVGLLLKLNVGVHLDIAHVTKQKLLDTLHEVLYKPEYRKNMEVLSEKFKDDVLPPEKLVVYWTEYVLKHNGATHLIVPEADISLYKYLMLDIIGAVIMIFIAAKFLFRLIKQFVSINFNNYKENEVATRKKKIT